MGGDGSLGRFMDDITADEIIAQNLNRFAFAPLPYGNGNDISRTTGWGRKPGSWSKNIYTMASTLLNGKRDNFALWDIEYHCS
jgi:diacylglycerol kinase family enzyme